MNVAGPSRLHPVPRARRGDNYEEDLTHMIDQLNLADVEILRAACDDSVQQGDGLSDYEVAFALLMQNVQELAQINTDRVLAERLAVEGAREDPAPRPAIRVQQVIVPQPAIRNTTQQTWSDWIASFFSMFVRQPAIRNTTQQTWSDWVASFSSMFVPQPAIKNTTKQTWGDWVAFFFWMFESSYPSPSNPSQEPTTAVRTPRHDCVICQDPILGAEIRAPCGHFYDVGCITDLFQSATRDESLYPPRCCRQIIPLPQVRSHLSQALFTEFELKGREFLTVKRVYCSAPACSRFLGPLYEGYSSKVFTCSSPTCTTKTCGKCRGRYEGYHNCTPDAETERVLTLSRASGWSRCPGCAQMIELNMGCFHVTCRCRTEFCYVCSARWKTCRCPQWNENSLLAAAERHVDAQLQHAHHLWPAEPPQQVHPARHLALAAGTARNQPFRQMPAIAPRPRPIINIRPVNPPQQVPAVALRPPPVINMQLQARHPEVPATQTPSTSPSQLPIRRAEAYVPPPPEILATRGAEVYTTLPLPLPPPPPPPPPPFRPTVRHTESCTPVPAAVTQPSRPAARCAEAHTRGLLMRCRSKATAGISALFARVTNLRPAATVSTATVGKARERMIRETMDHLRMDHDCQHTTWKYQRGSGRCENCSVDLPNYFYRCGGCEILSCNRCRRNRL